MSSRRPCERCGHPCQGRLCLDCRRLTFKHPGRRPTQLLGASERDRYGFVATLKHVASGALEVRHYPGKPREGVRELAGDCDAEGWRLLSYSTPNTIYSDLARDGQARRASALPPEVSILKMVGRLDLLDSSVARGETHLYRPHGGPRGWAWRLHRLYFGPKEESLPEEALEEASP